MDPFNHVKSSQSLHQNRRGMILNILLLNPFDVIVTLDTLVWTRTVPINLFRMQPYWLTPGTKQYVSPASEKGPKLERAKLKKIEKRKALRIISHSQHLNKQK